MRIVILSISFILCAFSAQSQVLKSAGVWYFLDVDSMTARPAVLPNGTELAYVIGTKKIYYWDRGTSTWTEYSAGGGGLTMPFDSIYFNPTTADPDTAELKYNADLETFVFGADGTVIEIGQKSAWYIKNQTGSTINKGTVVRASGTLGSSGRILVSPMVIDGTVDSKYLLGITASDIADGADGYVIHFGKLRKFNTSSWSDGSVLYAGTGGTLTATEPSPPNLRLPIAFVVHSHATNGVLAIRIQTGNELHELHDVDTTGIDNDGVLVWDGSKWKASDGAAITTADTTSLLATKYWTNTNFFPILGGTLTGTGGAGFIGFPSQVSAPGTPASGLNVYAQGSSFNWKGTDGHERQFASTLTGGRTYTLPDVSGTFALGTGTADRSARWSATNTMETGSWSDNLTRLQAQVPVQFQALTTAGLPTGVTGYHVYNTTINGPGWYQGSRWAYALESTFARGTSTRVPYFDANGQITDNANFNLATDFRLGIGRAVPSGVNLDVYKSTGSFNLMQIAHTNGALQFQWNNTSGNTYGEILTTSRTHPISILDSHFWISTAPNNGYIGMGTKTPGERLDVRGTAYFQGQVRIAQSTFLNSDFALGDANSDGQVNFTVGTSSSNAMQVTWDSPNLRGDIRTAAYTYPFLFSGGNLYVHSGNNTGNVGVGTTSNPDYKFQVFGTNAIGLPRGTVAQRPTIVSSTTPLRFDTDSTALEYGESVGTWRLLATRAYARYLVSGLTPDTWLGTRLPAASVDINANANSLTIDSIPKLLLTSQSTAQLGGAQIEQWKWLTTSRSKYYSRSLLYDSRPAVSTGSMPSYYNLLKWNLGSGEDYEWAAEMRFDTTNLVFIHGFGGRYKNSINNFRAQRPNNSSYILDPAFDFLESNATNTGRNGSIFMTGRYATDTLFSIYRNGTFSLKKYGVGNKEAADLSKTQSNYIVGLATDGTALDLEQKRDTTIFLTADTDYDFSAAVTTAQISSRYNRIIIHMTLTSGAGADKTTTLHAPDANLMQCEILIRGTDNTGTYDNEINFGTNNAISSDGTNTSGYTLAQGQGLHVRVAYNGSAYKYIYY